MSGFEVAGLALGAIPIIVSGLELSIKGISTLNRWRAYRRHIDNLILDLETEHCKLKNVLEHLLEDIAPSEQIEQMIRDPFGPSWHDKAIQSRVQQRLWNSDKIFRRHIVRIQEAVEELKERLGIDESFNETAPASGLKTKFKQMSSFIVSGTACKDLLMTIKQGIDDLDKLMSQNTRLEPKRKANSQGRFSRLVREMSRGIHGAIRRSLRCQSPHNVALQLESRAAKVLPEDSDEDILQRMSFALGLSSSHTNEAAWEEVVLRLAVEKHSTTATPPPCFSTPRRSVRFTTSSTTVTASNQRATTTLLESTVNTLTLGAPYSPIAIPEIEDLCKLIHRAQQDQTVQCEGRISGPPSDARKPREFDIAPRQRDRVHNSWTPVPLSEVLENKMGKYPSLSYLDKLRLACIISSNVVRLQETPWIPSLLSLKDIYFASREGSVSYGDVFVMSRMPDTGVINNSDTMMGVQNLALVALGILLLELKTGQLMSQLRPPIMPSSLPHIWIDYDNALKQLDKVSISNASLNYDRAVRSCLRCEFHQHRWSFDDEKFRQYAYDEVVTNLEQDLRFATDLDIK